jgi:hypothetical protein
VVANSIVADVHHATDISAASCQPATSSGAARPQFCGEGDAPDLLPTEDLRRLTFGVDVHQTVDRPVRLELRHETFADHIDRGRAMNTSTPVARWISFPI